MTCIQCRKSAKTGKEYICLTVNGVIVFVDDFTMRMIVSTTNYTMRDVYSLEVGESIEVCM